MPADLVVSELFGPTVQGEGPSTGKRATFLRLGRCDLACVWCDTPYTWDWTGRNGVAYRPDVELARRAVPEVVDELLAMDTPLIVITGGEPLLQRGAVEDVVSACLTAGRSVEIETNGRHRPLDTSGVTHNVSPKLASSGEPRDRRIRPDVLRALSSSGAAIFKFVCEQPADLDEVGEIVGLVGIRDDDVWIVPQATTAPLLAERARALADHTIARGWNLSGRLHIALWGDERGR